MMHLSMLLIAALPQAVVALPPEQAIARADAEPEKGVSGIFEMTVALIVRTSDALYLNSSMDISSPGNLVVRLAPDVAHQLERKLGGRVGQALIGRTVRVKGTLKRVPIVSTSKGTVRNPGPVGHEVRIVSLSNLAVR